MLESMNNQCKKSQFKIQDSVYLPFTKYVNYLLNISMFGVVTSRNHQACTLQDS